MTQYLTNALNTTLPAKLHHRRPDTPILDQQIAGSASNWVA